MKLSYEKSNNRGAYGLTERKKKVFKMATATIQEIPRKTKKGMKILVTGVAGFIGSHLAEYLVNDGHQVVGVDIKPEIPPYRLLALNTLRDSFWDDMPQPDDFNFVYRQMDLREYNETHLLINSEGFDQIFHLAANMGGIGYILAPSTEIMRDNLRIDINMIDACIELALGAVSKNPQFLYASSACIYPEHLQEDGSELANTDYMLREEQAYPADPDSDYGWEKLTTERLLQATSKEMNIPIRIARFHNIYGPGIDYEEPRSKVIGALCRKAIRHPEEEFIIWGDGKQQRSFCYIDDLIDGLRRLMNSGYTAPINLGSTEIVSMNDLATAIIDISGKSLLLRHDLGRPQGVRNRNADITEAKQFLDWEPKTSLYEGVQRTYRWIQEIEEWKKTDNEHE